MQQVRHKLRGAIVDLSRHGCDLTDPLMNDGDRADDATFHLAYLEEYCGSRLTVNEVMDMAHGIMRDIQAARYDGFFHPRLADPQGPNVGPTDL